MRAPARALSAALSLSVLTLGVAACGGDPDEADGDAGSAVSATPTESSDPVSPDSDETTDPSSSVSTAPGAGPEVAPFLARLKDGFGDEGSVHVQMTMSGTGEEELAAEGDSTYGPEGSDMRVTMELSEAAGDITMLLVDDEVYLSIPGVTPKGKYFEVPEDSPVLAGLEGASLSPADSFAGFEAGLVKVVEKGDATLDGEDTERFELHLDADRAMEAMGSGEETAELPETLVYDLWLDSEDRMRRIVYAVAGTEVTMDMTRWNDVEPVTAPAAEDVIEPPKSF